MNPKAGVPSRDEVLRLCALALKEFGTNVAGGSRLADDAYRMAKKIKDRHSIAEALRMKAHADHRSARYRRAARTYERAARILDELGEHSTSARARSAALQSLIYLGRFEDALAWADKARRAFEREGDALRLARLETNVGNILHRQERHVEALEVYGRALTALRALGDEESAAITMRNMAVTYIGTLQFELALASFEQAREIFVRLRLPVLASEVDDNIAYLHYLEGNYTQAIALYQATRSREGQNPHKAAIALLDQSDLYLELNLFQEAAQLAAEAMERFERLGMRPETARSLQNLGVAHLHLGNVEQSLAALSRVRRIFVQEKNPVWVAVTDVSRALALLAAGRGGEALALAEQARAELRASSFASKAVMATILAARIRLGQGDTGTARELASEARGELKAANAPHLRLSLELVVAEAAHAAGHQQAALSGYLAAHSLAEDLRRRLVRDEIQLSFLEDKRVIYEGLVGLLTQAGDLEGAFQFVEHAKSRALAEALGRDAAPQPGPHGPVQELRTRLRRLYRRLDDMEARPVPPSEALVTELRQRTAECERELALAATGAAPGETRPSPDSPTAAVDQVQAALRGDEAFLQYFIVRDALMLFAVTKQGVRCVDLGPVAAVREASRMLRFQLSRGSVPLAAAEPGSSWLAATQQHLERLYRLLIEPAAAWLSRGHWTIAPHGELHRLPFHALSSGGRYLIDDRSISYAPSASVWLQCLKRSHGWREPRAVVLGVPDSRCPSVQPEAESVARLLSGAELYLGAEAKLDRLKASRGSRFVHIASHGVFRADNPAFSSVQLGDNRLFLFDLREIKLDAELVTLSGCATGVHESGGADEILGLTRGVLLAGARAAQVTLWAINDRSTSEYMTDFYSRLAAGEGLAEALRGAMIRLRERYPHPYFWAPFALTGGVSGKVARALYQTAGAGPLT